MVPERSDLSLEARLRAGLVSLELAPERGRIGRFVAYLDLLQRWNRVYNLTAVTDPAEMVGRHLLDSLSVAAEVKGPRTLDVGSGAGFPGVPLAILLPGEEFVLLDASAKRSRFLRQVTLELALENVQVVRARIQDYDPPFSFDTIITRAFSSLREFVDNAGRLCAPGGRLLAMKGRRRASEFEALPPGYRMAEVRALVVPGQTGERHLVTVIPADGSALLDE
jgi:16S rRNA (guanine527-N7)-methyltransferase